MWYATRTTFEYPNIIFSLIGGRCLDLVKRNKDEGGRSPFRGKEKGTE